MDSLDRPKLRPLIGRRLDHNGRTFVALEDPVGVLPHPVLVPIEGFHHVVRHFDGQTPLSAIQARVVRETGQLVTQDELRDLIAQLDQAMVLDGPTFAAFQDEYRRSGVRPAAHAGTAYAGTERALRAQLAQYFVDARGAGRPQDTLSDGAGTTARPLRGIVSPHIDFSRGGPTYTWSYRELVERCEAETFVILGVAHHATRHRFALTRKDFQTPLGLARTDRGFVDRLADRAGAHLFDDELAHRAEHSIEFQVVFLQYLLDSRRDFSIVPILVGSFQDLMDAELDPMADAEVRRFIQALRSVEASGGRRVAYIAGIDLGHVGPEFGDPSPVDERTRAQLRRFDQTLLDRATDGDASGWFRAVAAVQNRWRICGLAATYTLLQAMGPAPGRVLRYDQAVDPQCTGCVSFASLAFDQPVTNLTDVPTDTDTDTFAHPVVSA